MNHESISSVDADKGGVVMSESLLHDELVLLDCSAKDSEELLTKLAAILKEQGYVKDSYTQAIIDREKVFPTGLNTPGAKVVMPHTDPVHVNKAAILVARLSQPVLFKEMGNSGKSVEANLVFMLAVTDPKGHLATLSKLMSIFSNGEKLLGVYNSKTKTELIEQLDEILA